MVRNCVPIYLSKFVAMRPILAQPARYGYLAHVRKAQKNGHKLSSQDRFERGCSDAAAHNFVGFGPARVLRETTVFSVITYSVFFRTRDGQQRFYKIGRHGV
jgi:hypothetical protein